MHEKISKNSNNDKEIIKNLIKKLHAGEDPKKVKEEFKEIIKKMSPLQISQAEEMLIKEGMPAEEIHHMCDIHLAVLQESLNEESDLLPEGHPINILMKEHAILLDYANNLRNLYKKMKERTVLAEIENELHAIKEIINNLKASESHYLREENILFSYLERYGVTQPPKIMWIEHDRIREIEKNLFNLFDEKEQYKFQEFLDKLHLYAHGLAELLASHFSKENRVLFPTALQLFSEKEWGTIRKEFDEVGYCSFTPERLDFVIHKTTVESKQEIESNLIDFGSGKLSIEQLKMLFKALPIDITFVNEKNEVEFYSEGPDRIFVRTPSVIGRLVENCHPDKSVERVLEIIDGFRNNTLDKAEFWLELHEKFILIRYFPVRNSKGEYKGVLEVTQNITEIKKIEGEKRLL